MKKIILEYMKAHEAWCSDDFLWRLICNVVLSTVVMPEKWWWLQAPVNQLAYSLQDLPRENATEHHWDSSLHVVTAILDDSTQETEAKIISLYVLSF